MPQVAQTLWLYILVGTLALTPVLMLLGKL